MDLLEEAGIERPLPWIVTPGDRAKLARVALAQRQFVYIAMFVAGLVGGASLAYLIGYGDVIRSILGWLASGTGIALVMTVLNTSLLTNFLCPRCGQHFFFGVGAPMSIFSKQCGNCGLPLYLPDDAPDSED